MDFTAKDREYLRLAIPEFDKSYPKGGYISLSVGTGLGKDYLILRCLEERKRWQDMARSHATFHDAPYHIRANFAKHAEYYAGLARRMANAIEEPEQS